MSLNFVSLIQKSGTNIAFNFNILEMAEHKTCTHFIIKNIMTILSTTEPKKNPPKHSTEG